MRRPLSIFLGLFITYLIPKCCSLCVLPSIEGLNGTYRCQVPSAVFCNDGSNLVNSEITVTKQDEGKYKCCCEHCSSGNCGDEIVLFAKQTADPEISRTLKLEWNNKPAHLKCPYTPGANINNTDLTEKENYKLTWSFTTNENKFTGNLETRTAQYHLDKPNNILTINNFSPLFEGRYTCSLTIPGQSPNSATLNVSVEPQGEVAIVNHPEDVVLFSSEADSNPVFQCTANITNNETIGFKIDNKAEMSVDNDECEVNRGSQNITCANESYTLYCDYSEPYRVSCNLTLLTQPNSNSVQCFVRSSTPDHPETLSSSAGLFVIPSSFSDANVTDRTLIQDFNYPITISLVQVRFMKGSDNKTVNGSLSMNNRKLTVKIPDEFYDKSVTYQFLFNSRPAPDIGLALNVSDDSMTSSTPTMSLSSTPTTITKGSTSIPSSSITSSPNMTTVPAAIGTPIVVGISIGIVVLVSVILLLIILLIVISRKTASKKRCHDLTDNACNGSAGRVEESELLAPMNYLSVHSSPYHTGSSCDTCSQVSTNDTYMEEVSPQHNGHPSSHSSRSSHSHSSNSCPSTRNLNNKPLPRYGIPYYHQQPQEPSLHSHSFTMNLAPPTNSSHLPEISVITPTPTMENQPVLGGYPLSPTGTEPFSSPSTPSVDDRREEHFTQQSNRPSNLPIAKLNAQGGTDSAGSTPLSDQTMIGVLLYLQHKDCNKQDNCQTCQLIQRHFRRIATKYGDRNIPDIMKTLNTPGAEGPVKLRRRDKKPQRLRSPHGNRGGGTGGLAPTLGTGVVFKRQRSHSASHIADEELTTETDDDSLNFNRRVKPMQLRKAVTDDEQDDYGRRNQTHLTLQRINEGLSLSQHDLPTTPLNYNGSSRLPGGRPPKGKDSETDSTDSSTSSKNDTFDGSKKSGISVSYMKSPDVEESIPPSFIQGIQHEKVPSLTSSSGYDTDSVFINRTTSGSGSDQEHHSASEYSLRHLHNPHHTYQPQYHLDRFNRLPSASGVEIGNSRYDKRPSVDNGSLNTSSSLGGQQKYHSDLLIPQASTKTARSNLSPSDSGILSMHSSPLNRNYNRYGSQASNGSNHSNQSIHSESAIQVPSKKHKQQYYSPPERRKHMPNGRTPSPIQLTLPSHQSSATPI